MVCRVFKKKNHINRGFQPAENINGQEEHVHDYTNMKTSGSAPVVLVEPKQNHHHHLQALCDYGCFDGSMHLPQLFSPDHHTSSAPSFISPVVSNLNTMDIECSQNLLRLTSTTSTSTGTTSTGSRGVLVQQDRFNGDWSFLEKLLASHHSLHQDHYQPQTKSNPSSHINNNIAHHHPHDHDVGTSSTHYRFPFQYLGCCDTNDILKFSK